MKLLKSFSTTTGIEPEEATIYQKFFPLPFKDYIVLNTQNEDRNANYVFWNRVIELINPILDKNNVEIIQFVHDKIYEYDHVYVNQHTTLNEKTYLLKNAKFFCGSSNLYSLICSENNVPQCFLKYEFELDNNLANEDEVINGKEDRKAFLNPIGNYINNIRPEEVAKKIINSLFPEESTDWDNTLYVGKVHSVFSIDLIPDCYFKINKENYKDHIIVRMDQHFSEINLEEQLKVSSLSVVTNKPISTNLLTKYKSKIKNVFFKIEKNSDENFLKTLQSLQIKFQLMTSLSEEDLNDEKIKYLDYSKINKLNLVKTDSFLDGVDLSKVKFKTNKIIIKSEKMYASRWHLAANQPSRQIRSVLFDLPPKVDDNFKEDADNFYFLTSEQF